MELFWGISNTFENFATTFMSLQIRGEYAYMHHTHGSSHASCPCCFMRALFLVPAGQQRKEGGQEQEEGRQEGEREGASRA